MKRIRIGYDLRLDENHKAALILALGSLKGLQELSNFHLPEQTEKYIIDILIQLGVTLFSNEEEKT